MDIREEYVQGNILKVGQILEGNLEIIDRRSNYVVVVDKTGKDYKMFLEEAFERIIENVDVVEQKTPNKKKTIRQILEGQENEIEYKGYKSRNLKFFDELRESLKEELFEQTEDPYANLRYLKAVDEMVAFHKKETEEGLSEEEINHLSRLIDRAKKYGHSKESYKRTPYHDRDIRTTNAKNVEDEHPAHERDGIRLKKFMKQEPVSERLSISVRDFLAESVDFTKADKELDSLEKNKEASEKLADKIDDLEDIAHLYHHDDIHIFEELAESLSREERIRRKISFSKSKSKRERAKEIALKRLSNKPKLIKKARKAAIELIKEHIARKPLNKLTVSEKERLENMIAKRKELIDRLARKLAPKISQIERNRVYGQHVKEAKEQEEIAANLVDDDFVDVADSDEEEGNDVEKDQKDKAHDHHMRKKFVVEEDECCEDMHESLREELIVEEAEYQGKEVKLNKPFRTPGAAKKFAVYVKNDKGNVVKVTFGAVGMEIKRDDPERRAAYRARHNCSDPGPKWKANYWSCRNWGSKSVTDILKEDLDDFPNDVKEGTFYHGGANVPTNKLHNISFFAPKREHAESYARGGSESNPKIHEVHLKDLHKPARDEDVIQGAKELGHYEDEFTPANHYLTHSVVPQDNVYDLIYHLRSKGFDHARLHDNDYDGNEFTSVLPFYPNKQIAHKD